MVQLILIYDAILIIGVKNSSSILSDLGSMSSNHVGGILSCF